MSELAHNKSNPKRKTKDTEPDFNSLDKAVKEAFVSRFEMESLTHVGPIPPPQILSEYASIIPNGADRIMKMAEKEQDARIKHQKRVLDFQMVQSTIGQVLAFSIGLAAIITSAYVTIHGFGVAGGAIAFAGIALLIAPFLKVVNAGNTKNKAESASDKPVKK